jgi:hypothetical protein
MHIHAAAIGRDSSNTYAAANQATAAAQRAAEVRKRLLKAAQGADTSASPEESLLISRWLGQPQNEGSPAGDYRSAAEGEDSDFV